ESGREISGGRESLQPVSKPEQWPDDVPLNLGGCRIELAPDGVAQLALDLILFHVTVAAVDLDRVLGALHPALADVELRHRGFHENAAPLRGLPRRAIEQGACRFETHFHVDDLRRDRLELSD